MKSFIVFILQLLIVSASAQQKITLVKNGKSEYKIIISQLATKYEKRAASILQEYLKKISGAELPISIDAQKAGNKEIIIGETNRSNSPEFSRIEETLKEDGFRLKSAGNVLYISGGSEKGVIYGVVSFLEDHLGCKKYSPIVEYVPKMKDIIIDKIDDKQVPSARIRIINGSFSNNEDYKDWRKLSIVHDTWGDGSFNGYYVHTFNKLLPREKYFEKHPEYYSLVNGKRIPYGQLCLTNPDVLKITIENLKTEIEKHPGIKYWSVSQNDTYENCECPNCKAIDQEEGSPSGLMIRFVNEVAKAFPNKTITTLAYQYTRKPPVKTKPLDNVMITLCTIELSRSKPIEFDTTSKDFVDDIIGWSKISDNIMLWDYEVQFTNYLCPFPLFHTLQPNIQFFTKYNVMAHFQQCNLEHGVEFAELKGYYLSKMLWNPNSDGKAIIKDFMNGYYQDAGPHIQEYFDMLHSEGKKSNQRLDIYGTPVWNSQTYLSKENIMKYNEIFDKAEQAVSNKPEVLERIRIARLPVHFSILEIAKTDLFGERGWYKLVDGKFIQRTEMKIMLEDFYSICKKNNVVHLNETGLNIDTYYNNTLRTIDVQTEGNLAFQKSVNCFPLPDKKYFGTGPNMLTNGVKGTEDYKINWLGWEDQDCDIIIDLEKVTRIKEINVSILQMLKSWILFPLKITCSLSNDGNIYYEFKSIIPIEDLRKNLDIKNFTFSLPEKETRFIKFNIIGTKKLPDWHNYVGNKSWVFIDEVIIK